MAKEMKSDLESNSLEIHQRLDKTIEPANNLPSNLGKELTKRLREMFKTVSDSISDRGKLQLNKIKKNKEAIVLLQKTNAEGIKSLADQVFELKSMVRQQIERSDTTKTLVYEQREQVEARLQENRDVIATTHTQL